MTTRDKILDAAARNKPAPTPLPMLADLTRAASVGFATDRVARFTEVLTSIGGTVIPVLDMAGVVTYIDQHFLSDRHRIITTRPDLLAVAEVAWQGGSVHSLADVELAVIDAHFGVVENGAVWLTEPLLLHRVTPFIPQHLAVVLRATDLESTMHDGYARIGQADYDFGVFVAGPSKTADIEQSLVLGAHGPKTMTVFLLA